MPDIMDDAILDAALRWHDALRRDDADWDAFTVWLEADARHRAAYDEVALLEDAIDRHRSALGASMPPGDTTAPEIAGERRSPRAWLWGGGVAAAAVAATLVATLAPSRVIDQSWRAPAGASQEIALADGSRVTLAPASALKVAGDAREMTLDGAAYFDVPHRDGRTLVIRAGGYDVRDVGTRFEIAQGGGAVRVAVAEGSVTVGAPRFADRVTLTGGQRLQLAAGDDAAVVAPAAPGSIAAWRSGRLTYDDAPLTLVAADIGRYAGRSVTVDPAIATRRFSGVLIIGDGSGLVSQLQQLMGLDGAARANAIVLEPRRR